MKMAIGVADLLANIHGADDLLAPVHQTQWKCWPNQLVSINIWKWFKYDLDLIFPPAPPDMK